MSDLPPQFSYGKLGCWTIVPNPALIWVEKQKNNNNASRRVWLHLRQSSRRVRTMEGWNGKDSCREQSDRISPDVWKHTSGSTPNGRILTQRWWCWRSLASPHDGDEVRWTRMPGYTGATVSGMTSILFLIAGWCATSSSFLHLSRFIFYAGRVLKQICSFPQMSENRKNLGYLVLLSHINDSCPGLTHHVFVPTELHHSFNIQWDTLAFQHPLSDVTVAEGQRSPTDPVVSVRRHKMMSEVT